MNVYKFDKNGPNSILFNIAKVDKKDLNISISSGLRVMGIFHGYSYGYIDLDYKNNISSVYIDTKAIIICHIRNSTIENILD